ncbi:MAG: RIP metalloprotease RseP [Terracidiphilus sp.]|jgi:regulator of sigma E protease
MHEFFISIVAFIVLVGVMVVVHEFGHFAVAKLCGVRVEAFSVGFGPRLFGIQYGETDYKVCLLPLGGYVKMTGENPEQNLEIPGSTPGTPVLQQVAERAQGANSERSRAAAGGYESLADDPGAFTNHPRWQRMLIGVAGPVANFILAFGLMLFYYGVFNEVPKAEITVPTIEWVAPDSAAAKAGIQAGDIIRQFETIKDPDWDAINRRSSLNQGQIVPVTVDRGGKILQLSLEVTPPARGQDFDLMDTGYYPELVPGPIGVKEVMPGYPAAQAGLRAGDAIVAVDGHAFHAVQTLLAYMQKGEGKSLTLTVVRNGVTLPPLVAKPTMYENAWKLGFAPRPTPLRHDPLPFDQALQKSTAFCVDNSTMIFDVLGGIFTHKISVSQLSGPVGIARMAGDAAETRGWLPKFVLAAGISLNLGILNLMPFPILDGGLILLLTIESVIRRDINIDVKERIYQAAFVVLLVFTAFIIVSDVSKLPLFTHLKP